MTRKMLINATHPEEHRVAIVEDGLLTELDIEIAGKEQTRGNIYKASVVRVESSLQAAFVDYGGERLGFLQLGEIHPSYYPSNENGNGRNRPRINEILRPGKELVVQVVKEERGTKGAALTTFLSLAGRYMVLMPESDSKGISRKIENESERKQIKQAMGSLDLPENMGHIVRTAGIGKSAEELKRDFDYLVRIYRTIQERAGQIKSPALIFRESNLIIRCIRDYFSEDMDEVLVDDPQVFGEARDFFQMVMPEHARCVKLHQERRPIFSRYQIEEQIETISQNKVQLPSGGSIVLDSTEALVAVDVNSGKMASEQGLEATAYKTNMEAAAETARQLRLRDLGGLIVIDFIDMRDRKHIREVEKCLKDALKNDKSRVTVGRISQFGLLEMSRQRLKPTLAAGAYVSCPHCQGSGRVKSIEAQGIAFLRRIQTSVAKGQIGRVEGELPVDVAFYLLNEKREELSELERRYDLEIFLSGQDDLLPHESDLNLQKREKQRDKKDEEEGVLTPLEVAAIADTALEPAEEAQNETGAHAEGENQGRKKRRRRRRRRKDAAETPAAATSAGAETPDKEVEEKEATTVQPAPSPAGAPPQIPEEAQAPQEKSAPEEHAPPAAASEAQKEIASEGKEETGAEKPKPRRRGGRRPSRKPTAEAAPAREAKAEGKTTEPESPLAPEEKKEAPAAAPQATDLVPQEKTIPARKDGPVSPQPAQEQAPGDAKEAAPQTSAEQPPAEKAKKTAPARRKRTTPARKKTEQPPASETAAEETPAAQPEAAATEKPAEKKKAPARKRRTATTGKSTAKDEKKTSQEVAENLATKSAQQTADASSEKEGAPAEAAEKTEAGKAGKARKSAPRRRATSRAGTAAKKKAEEAEKPEEPVEKKEEKKKAPARKTPQRRSTRKKKEEEPEKESPSSEKKSSGNENSEDTK